MAKRQETAGQKWLRFLRGYTPNAQSQKMFAEHIVNMSQRYGIEPISFEHPFHRVLLSYFFADDQDKLLPTESLSNIVLTGTAGDGKTSLCYDLWRRIFGDEPPAGAIASRLMDTPNGQAELVFIFDFSSWTSLQDGQLDQSCRETLESLTKSVFGHGDRFFIIAINDGQFGELWRSLPSDSPILQLQPIITDLHATCSNTCEHRLALHSLSTISTVTLFERAYDALMSRDEWSCVQEEAELLEFSPRSSLRNNYDALLLPGVKERLRELIEICDGAQVHIPIRELLMWLCNILLGHPIAPDGVARPQDLRKAAEASRSHEGALHSTVFGDNLKPTQRSRYTIFRILDALRLGEETINDLDELIIFGEKIPEYTIWYTQLVEHDPLNQRNPHFVLQSKSYVEDDQDEYYDFLNALAQERRRLFFFAPKDLLEEALGHRSMWVTTVSHSADEYLHRVFRSVNEGQDVESRIIRKLLCGLNRIWTGHLADNDEQLYVAKGLDLSSAPISDILVLPVPFVDDWGEQRISIIPPRPGSLVPQVAILWRSGSEPFTFDLTLPRYEFLSRVAQGVMPTAFSKECWEDIITLKTRLMRDINAVGKQVPTIRHITTNKDGMIMTKTIAD